MTVKKKTTKQVPVSVGQKLLKFGSVPVSPEKSAADSGKTGADDQACPAKQDFVPVSDALAETKPQSSGLTEEQMQKIAENRRKATERQQQKRSQGDAQSPAQPDGPACLSPPPVSPAETLKIHATPEKPAEVPTRADATPEQTQKIAENRRKAMERQQQKRLRGDAQDAQSPAAPHGPACSSPPPVRPAETQKIHATPQKPAGVPNCADATPQKVSAPRGSSTPGEKRPSGRAILGCGSKFEASACPSWGQYNAIYDARLQRLRSAAQVEAKSLWSGDVAPQAFLTEIREYKSGEGHQLVLVGILFKEMKSRPNTIQQYKASGVVGGLPETADHANEQYWSNDDVLWLEDHTMRVKVLLPQERISTLVSGLVVAVKGTPTEDGDFKASSVCFTQMPEVPALVPLLPAINGVGPFVAFISGLHVGAADSDVAARRRAIEFLIGGDVPECDKQLSAAVKQVIVCGGLFAGGAEGCSWRPTATSLEEVDSMLVELASKVPVDVLPGRNEPTNISLPQKSMLPHLFPRAQGCSGLRLAANPYERDVGGMRVLGHAGQPVDDILRCSSISAPIQALTLTMEAMHLAPTVPDTLATQPFVESDPFVMDAMPHLLFSGGHSQAANEWRACARGDSGTQCVCVPSFHDHAAVVLVNLRDHRDVRVKEFGSGQDAVMGQAG